MYIADGATQRGAKAWCQSVSVDPGPPLRLRGVGSVARQREPPRDSPSRSPGSASEPPTLTRSTCQWRTFFTIWTAPPGASELEICIVNDNETPDGNDFALGQHQPPPPRRGWPADHDLRGDAVNQPDRESIDTLLCEGQRYTANGLDLGAGESGVANLRTTRGCDSTLTVNGRSRAPRSRPGDFDTTNCLGATVAFEGLALRRDTVITRVGSSQLGCDSTYVFTLRFFARTAPPGLAYGPALPGGRRWPSRARDYGRGGPPMTSAGRTGRPGPALTGVAAGTYPVTVRDADGCLAETEVKVEDPAAISIASGDAHGGSVLRGSLGARRLRGLRRDGRPLGRGHRPGRAALSPRAPDRRRLRPTRERRAGLFCRKALHRRRAAGDHARAHGRYDGGPRGGGRARCSG